jgi:magnesium and cobalt exporter, CNNM family
MITTGVFLAALPLLLVLTSLAAFEASLSRISKVSVRRLLEKNRSKTTEQLKELVDNRLESLISVYVGIQLCTASLAIAVTAYMHNRLQSYAQTLPAAFGIMFLIIVIFRQLIPRLMARRKPEQVLLWLIPIHNFLKPLLSVVSYPLSSTLKILGQFNSQAEEEKTDEHIEEEIQAFIDVGKEEGILKKEEAPLFQSVVEFGDKVAGDIMTPRTEMVTIEIASSLTQLKKLMTETKYSRIPVYRDQVENIEGFIYLKDLVDIWDTPAGMQSLEKLVRPILFVPETKKVAELLKELQRKASHMAIVVDEFGGVAGLVTIEDILEEIAGEIHDEDEIGEMMQISRDANGHYVIPGNTSIHEVEELFGVTLDSGENTTIAGFINSVMGRVPRKGEKYQHQGLEFEVKEADRRKIHKLLVSQTLPTKALSVESAEE